MRLKLTAILCAFVSTTSFGQESFTLEEAQNYAVENSYSAQTSQMDVEKARKRVNEITAIGLPQINANGSYQNFLKLPKTVIPSQALNPMAPADEFTAVTFGTEQNMSADITANQLIFDGSYIVGLRAAKTYVELSKNNQIKSEIEIKNQVASAYYTVLAAEENTKILVENFETVEAIYQETLAMYETGFLEEQDADQLKLTRMNLKNSIDNAKRQADIARNLLKFQMGKPISEDISLSDDITTLMENGNKPEFLTTTFDLSSHIDFRIIETGVRASELTLKNERAAYLPKLNGFFTHQQQSFSNDFSFFGDAPWYPSTFWGLNLQVPIFSSFMKHNKVQQAKIELDKITVQRSQMEENLKLQVETARSNYAYSIDNLNTAEENMELAKRIVDKTSIKYKEGLSSSLELSQTENQYLTAQGNYIQSILNLLNSKTQLDKALNNY